ncbi:high-temperature-induced dauer-formation protein-domain-containing protein [Fimicolochytrium jonesii]|uniref:high-temperature-induced dauer-formation protein-domain-containing protein n=1 Tax=Fimicolochytrium jonesii TaxID=1396493 RepID=UPI0022FE48F0|nr:high-temperature-induced dauer-formation protein-domain-containing protein [Fimicolochytrium jonesii]KAI8817091.1 high-temperature-induced dauer-formation protein-domain-containing protein [Fimicolochytrium jonesii]
MGATESKLAFRKNVFQLYEQQVPSSLLSSRPFLTEISPNLCPFLQNIPPTSQEFWHNFYTLPDTAEDVFNLFAPKDIRRVRDVAGGNLVTLIEKILDRISTFLSLTTPPTKDDAKEILNCIRILTRLLPYIFEAESDFEDKLFWSGDDLLAPKLCRAVVQLLFFRGFTLPEGTDPQTGHGVQYIIWEQGVGASVSPATTRTEITHRTETLRLLLTLLSRTIYIPTAKLTTTQSRWSNAIVTGLEKKATLSLLCSLLNTSVNYDPVGWGMLPYNHLIFANVQEQFVMLCLQTLVALLDARSPIQDSAPSTPDVGSSRNTPAEPDRRTSFASGSSAAAFNPASGDGGPKRDALRNDFAFYAGKLHRPQDFLLIMTGFCRILKNPLESANTYLPGSTKRVNLQAEVLMLFWKLMESNPKFQHQAMETDKILIVLASILYLAVEARNDPSQVGFLRMCSFLLHMLSQDRNFSVQLNGPFDHAAVGAAAKAVPNFTTGTWADFLFLAVHTLCTSTTRPPTSIPLHEPLLTALANVSPYVKTLSVTTANKLLSLYSAFASPAFMLANEYNHKNVFYVLEVFNNLVQYQVTGNTPLLYALVRYKQKFYALHDLTFEHANAELQRIRALRAQKLQQAGISTPSTTTTPTAATSNTNGDTTPPGETSLPTSRRESEVDHSEDVGEVIPPQEGLSEKGKGKLPAHVDSEEGGKNDGDRVDGAKADGKAMVDERGKFVPTQEWFAYWHAHLPLHTLLTLLSSLAPTIEQLCVEQGINDDRKVLEYLNSGTLVGVLPVPHPIFVRRFVGGVGVRVWFVGWFWGCVYMKSNAMGAGEAAKLCPPIWTGTHIRLFTVRIHP